MFELVGEVNLEQTLTTLMVLAGFCAAYKPLLGLIQRKLGLTLTTTGVEVRKMRVADLYSELVDVYRTQLTDKPMDYLVIKMEEQLYNDYKRLGGNGFIDILREEWLTDTAKVIKGSKHLGKKAV